MLKLNKNEYFERWSHITPNVIYIQEKYYLLEKMPKRKGIKLGDKPQKVLKSWIYISDWRF